MFFSRPAQISPADMAKKIDIMTIRGIDSGEIIRIVRTDRGVSQDHAAEKIGVSLQTYKYLEDGVFEFTPLMILKLYDLLDVEYDFNETLEAMFKANNCV